LSAPNRIGATVKAMRSNQNDWKTGLSTSALVAEVMDAEVVGCDAASVDIRSSSKDNVNCL
jgi:hypothetical protein